MSKETYALMDTEELYQHYLEVEDEMFKETDNDARNEMLDELDDISEELSRRGINLWEG